MFHVKMTEYRTHVDVLDFQLFAVNVRRILYEYLNFPNTLTFFLQTTWNLRNIHIIESIFSKKYPDSISMTHFHC